MIAPSISKLAKISARSDFSPTIMRDGYKLSYKALPSRKNSGEKIILSTPNFAFNCSVKPTGTVDLITIIALGLIDNTSCTTDSTLLVSK